MFNWPFNLHLTGIMFIFLFFFSELTGFLKSTPSISVSYTFFYSLRRLPYRLPYAFLTMGIIYKLVLYISGWWSLEHLTPFTLLPLVRLFYVFSSVSCVFRGSVVRCMHAYNCYIFPIDQSFHHYKMPFFVSSKNVCLYFV